MDYNNSELSDSPLPVPLGGNEGRDARKKALFDGCLQWKRKPESYGLKISKRSYIQSREAVEARTRNEFLDAIANAAFKPIGHEDGEEVEDATFPFRDDHVLCERFLKVDLAAREPFAASQIQSRRDAALLELGRNRQLTFNGQNERSEYLASSFGLLRSIPQTCIYIALDKNDKVLVHLDPLGVERAFGKKVKTRMERDSILFYYHKKPERNFNKRHASTSEAGNRRRNNLLESQCGTDHYGHRHPTGDPYGVIGETKDFEKLKNYDRQLLFHYLKNIVGTITRLLDFEFGYLNPELRGQYREVYKKSPEAAGLRPTNGPRHEETYCFRAVLVNMPTDEHKDQSDWKGGLTGLVQIGKFRGAAMVLKQLGIVLPGYRSGASLQFRGSVLNHFITEWNGKCRYAFDHTTHESVRQFVEKKKERKRLRAMSDETSEDSQSASEDSSEPDEPETAIRVAAKPTTKRKRPSRTDVDSGTEHVAEHSSPPAHRVKLTLKCEPPPTAAATATEEDDVEFLYSKPVSHQGG